jgi:hypothetical protein
MTRVEVPGYLRAELMTGGGVLGSKVAAGSNRGHLTARKIGRGLMDGRTRHLEEGIKLMKNAKGQLNWPKLLNS